MTPFRSTITTVCMCILAAVASPTLNGAPRSDVSTQGVFNLVADTAAKICGEIPDSGWNVNASVAASLDVPLGEFFKKLLDARATGNVGIDGGKYAGPLREQLMQTRRDTQDCKKIVADKLLQYVRDTQKIENVAKSKRVEIGSTKLVPNTARYPKQSAEEFADWFIQLVDSGDYSRAYDSLDPSVRAIRSRKAFIESMQTLGANCYPALARKSDLSQGRMIPASQSMFRKDEYGYSYQTTFKDGKRHSSSNNYDEVVGVALSDDGKWQALEFVSGCLNRYSAQ